MPILGLGVWQTPPGRGTREAVGFALGLGCRLIDTAALYRNEKDVGEAIRLSGVPRDEIFVTTKVWNDDQGYETTLRAFEKSRAALGVDYVDLYLIHWPVPGKREESWRALTRLRKDGKCRSIGVSNYTIRHLEELLTRGDTPPAVNQVEFSPFVFQRGLLDYCAERDIQLEAYSPLARGSRMDEPVLRRIATQHQKSPAQILIRWGLQHRVIEIPKSAQPERIRENLDVRDFQLTSQEMTTLDGLNANQHVAWNPTDVP